MAKRILIYTNHFFPENFKVNDIAEFLSNQGNKVHVVTGLPNYPSGKIFKGYGLFKKSFEQKNKFLSIRRLPLIPRGNGSKTSLILNYISYFLSSFIYTLYLTFFKKKYDVIFVHHTSPVFITIPPIFYRWVRKSKNILWDLDMWPETLVAMEVVKNYKLVNFMEWVMKGIYTSYDKVLLGSRSFLEKATQRVGYHKVGYFPNWAEEIFTTKNIIIPKDEPVFPKGLKIMYAGNVGQAQDFEHVIQTIKILKNESVIWLIVGDGRKKEWFERQVTNEGLERNVIFYGNQPLNLMPYFFSKADVMFLSLKNELIFHKTVPAKLQSYMAFGKPVLAMISGEGAQIIRDSSGGFVAESSDVISLARLVKEIVSLKKAELLEMGISNQTYYREQFSLEARKNQLREIIES